MNRYRAGGFLRAWALCACAAPAVGLCAQGVSAEGPTTAEATAATVTAQLDLHRALGRAQYENDDFRAAEGEFRRCVELAPESAPDRYNLAIVLLRMTEYDAALAELEKARALDPTLLGVHYLRGIVNKRTGDYAAAVRDLEYVVERDKGSRGAYYNLGDCYRHLDEVDKALAAFRAAVAVEPGHPSSHYQLLVLARRAGLAEEAERHAEIYNRVKDTIDASEKTAEALERSAYSALIELPRHGADPNAVSGAAPKLVEATKEAGLGGGERGKSAAGALTIPRAEYESARAGRVYAASLGGGVVLGDYDGDGDLDIYEVNAAEEEGRSANRLWRNNGKGRFADVTRKAGVGDAGAGMAATFGDHDNDGHADLYVVNCGANVLYRNKGDGTFEDVSARAGVNEPQCGGAAVLFDYDHDNDLDLFIANDADFAEAPEREMVRVPDDLGGAVNTLLRNNGDGTFTDRTDEAGLLIDVARSRAAIYADFDGDVDTDLFVLNADAAGTLFTNQRLGVYAAGGEFSPALPEGGRAAAETDVNRDGRADLIVAAGSELRVYVNRGGNRFEGRAAKLPEALGTKGVAQIVVADLGNDGWGDLLLLDGEGETMCLAAPGGAEEFAAPHAMALAPKGEQRGSIAAFAVGDVDGDGRLDLVVKRRGGGVELWRDAAGEKRHSLAVKLTGKKSNRSGVGATAEIVGGGHYQRQTARGEAVHFCLGSVERVDVVRITWPNGVVQNVIQPGIDQRIDVEEVVKVSASCGFLYAWNGARFELVNEILGIGPLGVPMAPGVYHQPDSTELTLITGEQLAAREGYYELRLTEELRETMYADRFELRVIDHPPGTEIAPNEYFTAPPFPEDKFFAPGTRVAPRAAADERGRDVLPLVRERDGRVVEFPLAAYEGIAEPHALTLDLGDLRGAERIMLYLDGWIYWPESSTVMALDQDSRYAIRPLSLEVPGEDGAWTTAIESVGLPTSKGLVVPVELTGRFLSANDYRVRLSTNLCVYFDRVFVGLDDRAAECIETRLSVAAAELRYRGFSRMQRDERGFETFDYQQVSPVGNWSPPQGMLTRYGEVTELLGAADNRYVIFGPGDELAMRFDARGLPALREGWRRSFVFYAVGWVKDGDLNTTYSGTVEPLPFHGMSGYPYPAGEQFPRTPDLEAWRRAYNTRAARPTVGDVHAVGQLPVHDPARTSDR